MRAPDPEIVAILRKALPPGLVARALRSFGMLSLCLFSAVFLFAAPFELSQVQAVRSWPALSAHVEKIELVDAPFHKGEHYWRITIRLDQSGETAMISDIRPGDLPLSALGWSSVTADVARYQEGQAVTVFRGEQGGKIFLEQGGYGVMSALFLLSALFWIWVVRNRTSAAPSAG